MKLGVLKCVVPLNFYHTHRCTHTQQHELVWRCSVTNYQMAAGKQNSSEFKYLQEIKKGTLFIHASKLRRDHKKPYNNIA